MDKCIIFLFGVFFVPLVQGLYVRLYEDYLSPPFTITPNSTGCFNIPQETLNTTSYRNIETITCLFGYEIEDCLSSERIRISRFDGRINRKKWQFKSFMPCDETIIDPTQLNVDVKTYYGRDNTLGYVEPYRNICSCQNIPEPLFDMDVLSIFNHGNSLYVYNETDCMDDKWSQKYIRGQDVKNGDGMNHNYKMNLSSLFVKSFKSFGLDQNSIYFKTVCEGKTYDTCGKEKLQNQMLCVMVLLYFIACT